MLDEIKVLQMRIEKLERKIESLVSAQISFGVQRPVTRICGHKRDADTCALCIDDPTDTLVIE